MKKKKIIVVVVQKLMILKQTLMILKQAYAVVQKLMILKKKKGFCESYIERSYIDIFNMSDQLEGKFAYCNEKNKPCAKTFFEIYFPPEANELIRISLISQCIFLFKTSSFQREMFFAYLPGTKPELIKFYS